MLLLPLFLKRYGMKATLLIGMIAWACRYALFSVGDAWQLEWLLLVGIAIHGPCYDFFFVSGQIYTDTRAGQERQAAAQGLITLATYGVGMLIGFSAAGVITDRYSTGGRPRLGDGLGLSRGIRADRRSALRALVPQREDRACRPPAIATVPRERPRQPAWLPAPSGRGR